jgi:hypothetical protein
LALFFREVAGSVLQITRRVVNVAFRLVHLTFRFWFIVARNLACGFVPKMSFVTRVGELGCGVGYYK